MNSFKELGKKKLLLLGGIALLLIVIVVLSVVYYGGGHGVVKTEGAKPQASSSNPPGVAYKDQGNLPTQPLHKTEAVDIGQPTQFFGGVVADYKDNSTNAELTLNIGGDATKQKHLMLQVGSIVFDASKNLVMLPSQIAKGEKIRALVAGDVTANAPNAVVVIVNDTPSLSYSPVTGVEKGADQVGLLDNVTEMKYVLSASSSVVNALTGRDYDKTTLKAGDRIFFYEGAQEKLVNTGKDASKTTESPSDNKASISKDGKVSKDATPKIDTSTYTVVNVNKLYVYPSPQ